ncbi:peroxiredoxin family protein [Yunchengibacter salinarum]|uniref:peroxiredoxin family protein n=1 Tax=Yunchengibacter salinarum TaxID=3133399 RepID=UPI0035B5815E
MNRAARMSRLKAILVLPAIILAFAGVGRGAVDLATAPSLMAALLPLGWLLASLPIAVKQIAALGFGRIVTLGGKPGTLAFLFLAAIAGLASAPIVGPDAAGLAFLLLLIVNSGAFLVWFPRLPGRTARLKVGEPMPDVTFHTLDGEPVRPADLTDKPTFYLFFRGNWCPLCLAQIGAVAAHYQALAERGARVALVSPQPEHESAALGRKYGVDFTILTDPDLKAAERLGLSHPEGVPAPMRGRYGASTVLPTLVLVDRGGVIRFADQTDDYTVRPEPDVMIDILDKENASTT